jgi:hypothetical protein
VESVVADVPAPTEATLRTFFERYRNDLPDPRSDAPGFRKPRRAKYEYFVAKREAFEAAVAKDVTDEEIAAFYEKNKAAMFRAAPAAKSVDAAADKAGDKPATTAPESPPKPATAPQGAIGPRRSVQTVAFKQPAEAKPDDKPAEAAAKATPDAKPAAPDKPAEAAAADADADGDGVGGGAAVDQAVAQAPGLAGGAGAPAAGVAGVAAAADALQAQRTTSSSSGTSIFEKRWEHHQNHRLWSSSGAG